MCAVGMKVHCWGWHWGWAAEEPEGLGDELQMKGETTSNAPTLKQVTQPQKHRLHELKLLKGVSAAGT